MTLVLRPADHRDAAPLANIYLLAREDALPDLPRAFSDREIRDWIGGEVLQNEAVWAASDIGVIKGFAAVKDTHLTHLWVSPPFQRQGVGKALLTKAQGVSPKKLEAIVYQAAEGARAFFEAQGFRSVGAAPPSFDGAPRLIYRWKPS